MQFAWLNHFGVRAELLPLPYSLLEQWQGTCGVRGLNPAGSPQITVNVVPVRQLRDNVERITGKNQQSLGRITA